MVFNLDNFLPYRLSRLTNKLSRDLAGLYEDKFDINRTQWRVMSVLLSSGEQTAQSIAARTVMDKSVISRAVKGLIEKDYIRRGVSQTDGRAAPLKLTAYGLRIANQIAYLVLESERSFKARLGDQDLAQLERILTRLDVSAD